MNAMNAKLLSCAKFRPTALLVLSICNSARHESGLHQAAELTIYLPCEQESFNWL